MSAAHALSVAQAGLGKFFAEIGTPLDSLDADPVEPPPADIQLRSPSLRPPDFPELGWHH